MPLIGVAMSHAAFAGAVFGTLLGVNPVISGFIFCLVVAGALGPFSDRARLSPENTLGIFFSFLMGIAFLGMGILTRTKAGALSLMWGSLLSLSGRDQLASSILPRSHARSSSRRIRNARAVTKSSSVRGVVYR
jgi:manganese/iron transport system permease protein